MLAEIESNPRVTAVVLISGKPDTFIAGADIEMLKAAKTPRGCRSAVPRRRTQRSIGWRLRRSRSSPR